MTTILIGSLIVSAFHALLPNHWLPIVAIGRQQGWTLRQVLTITGWAGVAHVASTLLVGLALGAAGLRLSADFAAFSRWVLPSLLVGLGLVFVYRHHRHQHFHLDTQNRAEMSPRQIVATLAVGMFLSPCLEVEGYFLAAGAYGWFLIGTLALLYALTSLAGMLLWVGLVYQGLQHLNWHRLEHSAGLITGLTLIVTGLLSFFIDF